MKKLLSIFLCLAMVVGFFTFGVSAETTTATLVTDAATIKQGGSYVLVARYGDNYYAVKNLIADRPAAETISAPSSNTVSGESLPIWTVSANGTDGINLAVGSSYLTYNSSTKFKSGATAYKFTISASANGAFRLICSTANTRALAFQSSGNCFGAYATSNAGTNGYSFDIFFYKVGASGSGSGNEGSGSENQGGNTPTPTVTPDGYTYTKVTASSELTSGYYTMVSSKGNAPLTLDTNTKWVTMATPDFNDDDTLVNSHNAIWYLNVTNNVVTITSTSNVTIAPIGGNENGIKNLSAYYEWKWEFNDTSKTFRFCGQGSDTVRLAQNGSSGFRAYKTTTLEGNNASGYSCDFTLYKITDYTGTTITPPEAPQLPASIVDIAEATQDSTIYKVKGTVTLLDGSNVYIQDATGGICARFSAAPSDLQLGDVITVTGTRTTYNGLPQLGSATYEKSSEAGSLDAAGKTIADLTSSDICTYVTVSGTVTAVDNTYATPNITITDGTKTIQLYKAVVGDKAIKVGDRITITGAVGAYYETLQLRNTNDDEIDIVCSYDASKMTWTADDNGHQATCSVCSQIHVKCSTTTLETVTTDATYHWDECPNCDFATSKVAHSMSAQKDADRHWTECSCGKATEKVDHDMEYKSDETHHWKECKDCEHSTVESKEPHDFGTTYQKDEDNHWLACECGKENDKGAHNDGDDADKLCDKCGLDMSCTHANGYEWTKDATHHWEKCKDCGLEKPDSKVAHTMDNQHDADKHWSVCTSTNCGHATEKVEHDLEAKSNDTHRWQECKDCDYATEKEALPQSSNVLASGNYVLVDANGNAPLILDGSWVTVVAPTVTGGVVTDAKGAVWTLTVDGDTVILKDSNGKVIAPKGGNNNGIKEGDYKWKVVKNDDGTYSFLGQGDDTVILASNTGADYGNKYRAYKTSTISGNPDTYPCNFTLYPVTVSDDDSNDNNNENDNTGGNTGDSTGGNTGDSTGGNTGDSTEKIDSIKDALAGQKNDVFTVTGVVNLIDGKNVYIQDATGGICIYLSAAPEGLKLGDTITATGKRDTYNGLPELVQGTYEKVADGALELKPADKTLETLTAADVGTYVTLKDLVVVEVFDNDGAYSAPNITVQDAKGNKIQIYKAQVSKVGENWSVKVGDKLTVTASVGIYKETLQLRNTVAGEIVVQTANSSTGDIFGVIVAMMAISGMGLTAVLTKKH